MVDGSDPGCIALSNEIKVMMRRRSNNPKPDQYRASGRTLCYPSRVPDMRNVIILYANGMLHEKVR